MIFVPTAWKDDVASLCNRGEGSAPCSGFLALPAQEAKRRLEFEMDILTLQKDNYSDTRDNARFCNKVPDSDWEPQHIT